MSILPSSSRIAFTAAWSAAFSSPRPISGRQASAACSDTRARARDRRASLKVAVIEIPSGRDAVPALAAGPVWHKLDGLDAFDAQRDGSRGAGVDLGQSLERGGEGRWRGPVGDDQYRRGVFLVSVLAHPVDRDAGVAEDRR